LTQPIPEELKDKIIREYLKGKSRNEVARHLKLGAGTVTNVIHAWNSHLNEYEPEKIRELVSELGNAGFTPGDCVTRTRMVNKSIELDMDEDKFLTLIENIQTSSIQKGVPPEKCADLISELYDISNCELIPLDEVPNHVKQKVQENAELDSAVGIQKKRVESLMLQAKTLFIQNNVTIKNIRSFVSSREHLEELDLSTTDIGDATNIIRNFRERGLDARRIVQIASTTTSLQDQLNAIEAKYNSYRNTVSQYEELVPIIKALKEAGCGLSELCCFLNTITSRARIDHISLVKATQILMWNIIQEDRIIGFENDIQTKQLQIKWLEHKREELNENWAAELAAIRTVLDLTCRGVTGEEILAYKPE
jgi:transposase-like protein